MDKTEETKSFVIKEVVPISNKFGYAGQVPHSESADRIVKEEHPTSNVK